MNSEDGYIVEPSVALDNDAYIQSAKVGDRVSISNVNHQVIRKRYYESWDVSSH